MKQKHKRKCGGCTACCTTLRVNELHKKAGKPCQLCDEGVGCKVYNNRPASCRYFTCQWLNGTFSDEMRPDRCGVVFVLQKASGLPRKGMVLVAFEYRSGALEDFRSSGLVEKILEAGVFVIFRYLSGRGQFYAPIGLRISKEAFEHLQAKKAEVIYLPVEVAAPA